MYIKGGTLASYESGRLDEICEFSVVYCSSPRVSLYLAYVHLDVRQRERKMYMPNDGEELGEIGPSQQSSYHPHERENHAYQFNTKKKARGYQLKTGSCASH